MDVVLQRFRRSFSRPPLVLLRGLLLSGQIMAADLRAQGGSDTPQGQTSGNPRPERAFHFSARGDDEADGATPERAWRSLEKLRGLALVPGDEIVLAGGDEFRGGIRLPDGAAGTARKPIIIRGGGGRKAAILAEDTHAIEAGSGGIEIRDLILRGNPVVREGGKPAAGIRLFTADANGRRHPHLRIERVDISRFSGDGVSIGSWHDTQPGYDDVLLRGVTARDNGGTGILIYGKKDAGQAKYPHRNLLIRDCVASGNQSGSGIILGGVQGGAVEFCHAADNSGKGGGVAMWAYDCNRVTFRNCIARGTRTAGKDGGGFDLDGGCLECVVETCLSHDNHGPGFMHCDYPGAGLTKGNVIRSCVSINDGRRGRGSGYGFGFVVWGAGIEACVVEKCLAIVDAIPEGGALMGVLFADHLPGFAADGDKTGIRGCGFRNNVALAGAADIPLASNNLPGAQPEDVHHDGNSYLTRTGDPLFLHAGKRYSGPDAWRDATGQETRDGRSTIGAIQMDSVRVPADYRLTVPRDLGKWPLFQSAGE